MGAKKKRPESPQLGTATTNPSLTKARELL